MNRHEMPPKVHIVTTVMDSQKKFLHIGKKTRWWAPTFEEATLFSEEESLEQLSSLNKMKKWLTPTYSIENIHEYRGAISAKKYGF